MKTIFRNTNVALLFAAFLAFGAVSGFAQDNCGDTEGQAALDGQFRAAFTKKDIAGRKEAIDLGKQFLEKYGNCESGKQLGDYLKTQIPAMEKRLADLQKAEAVKALEGRFVAGMKTKNWDEVYSAGKALLQENPDNYRDIEIVLGSVGLDETAKAPRVTKWNDDTLRFAKQSIADLEGGKTFKTFGVFITGGANFQYKDKADAIAWMNYTIGYILTFDKNNKKEAVGYLYQASQANSDTKSNPNVFEGIGSYYYDDAKKLIGEVQNLAKEVKALEDSIKPTDTPEAKQQKLDAAKAKADIFKNREGVLNGTVERALDAYSRAYKLAPNTPAGKAYRDGLYKTLGELYDVRFEKKEGLDEWINAALAKPLVNPATAITPVIDPEPAATTTSTSTPVPTVPAVPAKPATPAAKPAVVGKPQSVVNDASTKSTGTSTVAAKPAAKAVAKKKGI